MMAINYTKKDERDFLRKELKEYVALVGALTPEERKALCEWVADGNHAVCNPWHMCGEDGRTMDYIAAVRIVGDTLRSPQLCCKSREPTSCAGVDDGSPF